MRPTGVETQTWPTAREWPLVEPRLGRDVVALVGLVLVAVGIPLAMSAAAGAIGLPTNDDWVYMHAANSLYQTGRLDISGHTTAFLGQLALVQPFMWLAGGQAWAFTAFGLVMAGTGIAATYLLARRYLGIGSAVMVALLVIVFPGFARSSASFMTDIPTYSLIMLCLLVGTGRIVGRSGRARLVVSLAIGLLAASIREFALAAPLAVLLVAWARSWRTDRAWLAAVSIALALGVLGILSLTASAPGRGGLAGSLQIGSVLDLGPAFATLAAVLLPVTVLYVGRRMERFTREQVLVAAALVCFVVFHPDGPIIGNLWTQFGLAANNILAGIREPLFGGAAWGMSRQAALFAAILAAMIALNWTQRSMAGAATVSRARAVAIRVIKSREGPLALFLVGYAAELALFSLLGGLFDRYLWPMVPVAAIILLRRSSAQPGQLGRSLALSHAAFAWLLISAVLIAANSFAYDAARQREGEAAVAMGYAPTTVDAGYEWVGIHAVGEQHLNPDAPSLNWYGKLWPSFTPCAMLSNTKFDLPTYDLIRVNESAYRQYLLIGPDQPLYLYGSHLPGCPTPHPVDTTSGN